MRGGVGEGREGSAGWSGGRVGLGEGGRGLGTGEGREGGRGWKMGERGVGGKGEISVPSNLSAVVPLACTNSSTS